MERTLEIAYKLFCLLLLFFVTVCHLLRALPRVRATTRSWWSNWRAGTWQAKNSRKGYWGIVYQEDPPRIVEVVVDEPFEEIVDRKKGYSIVIEEGLITIFYTRDAYLDADKRARARLEAIGKAKRLSEEARACGFDDLKELLDLADLTTLYGKLHSRSDWKALNRLRRRKLETRRQERQLMALVDFCKVSRKTQLGDLDERTRFALLNELRWELEHSKETGG